MTTALAQWIGEAGFRLGKTILWSVDKFYGRFSKVGDHQFFDNGDFPWVPAIESD